MELFYEMTSRYQRKQVRHWEKAREAGIYFVPSTGRALEAVPVEVMALPGVEYVITSNGAAVYSVSGGTRIYESLVPAEAVDALLEISMPENMTIEVFVKGIPYTASDHVKDPARYGATAFGIGYVKKRAILWKTSGNL